MRLLLALFCFPLQRPFAPAHAGMTSSTSFSHREALLSAEHGLDLQSINGGSDGDTPTPSPSRPHLGVSAEWSRQLLSFHFDPVYRSPLMHALGERREYYLVMVITVCLWILLVFQSFITGWAQVAIVVALLFGLNLPILLIELTRMDRRLLWRLLCTFEWWYLFLTYFLMQAMSLTRTVHIHFPSAADIVYLSLLNLIFLVTSTYTISMDCLVNAKARNKALWLIIFILYIGVVFALNRASYERDQDVELCLIYCATAGSIQSSCMLTVLAFGLKFLVNLIRHPQCLIILTPVCKLTQQDEARTMEPAGYAADPC